MQDKSIVASARLTITISLDLVIVPENISTRVMLKIANIFSTTCSRCMFNYADQAYTTTTAFIPPILEIISYHRLTHQQS